MQKQKQDDMWNVLRGAVPKRSNPESMDGVSCRNIRMSAKACYIKCSGLGQQFHVTIHSPMGRLMLMLIKNVGSILTRLYVILVCVVMDG